MVAAAAAAAVREVAAAAMAAAAMYTGVLTPGNTVVLNVSNSDSQNSVQNSCKQSGNTVQDNLAPVRLSGFNRPRQLILRTV